MKTSILALLFAILLATFSYAQDETNEKSKKEMTIYSFVVNRIPDGSHIPMLGFLNIACGTHNSLDMGFANFTRKNQTGAQTGFVNSVRGNLNGAQIGFVNNTVKNVTGLQVGFINTGLAKLSGAQVGFVNTSLKKSSLIQTGFINTCIDTLKGLQIGFINTSLKKTNASQIGFVNTAKTLKGTQIGFVNLADSIESGVPLGFLSIVKKGGYHALEVSVTEMYPVNFSYKIGVSQLYTTFNISYNPSQVKNIALGAGLGSIIPIGNKVMLNPEFVSQTLFWDNYQQLSSFAAMFGYKFNTNLSLLAGPSVVLQYGSNERPFSKPFFSFSSTNTKNNNNIITGFRLALRYQL
ncbi:MAG: hypothetical protein JXR50_04420 [Prolixibacteraceae bacterium]|nr:hypothetical protein [Prolixibacteraceae bacterium]MBN2648970.1 hypothetical protein [Prolixibacteraceae bacterium]